MHEPAPIEQFIAKREQHQLNTLPPLAQAREQLDAKAPPKPKYPGISRLAYALGHLGVIAFCFVYGVVVSYFQLADENAIIQIGAFIFAASAFALTAVRLRHFRAGG